MTCLSFPHPEERRGRVSKDDDKKDASRRPLSGLLSMRLVMGGKL